jgi:hypothetical protein
VRLPAADDLFRPTDELTEAESVRIESSRREVGRSERRVRAVPPAEETTNRKPSGRVRHDEKMTVYVTSDELLDIEHARLALRRDHGLAVDRGRMVREAIALVLADLEEHGLDSLLVQRLIEE